MKKFKIILIVVGFIFSVFLGTMTFLPKKQLDNAFASDNEIVYTTLTYQDFEIGDVSGVVDTDSLPAGTTAKSITGFSEAFRNRPDNQKKNIAFPNFANQSASDIFIEIADNAFEVDNSNDDNYSANLGIENIRINSYCKRIGESAFSQCKNLNSVAFIGNEHLQLLGINVFNGCINLKSVKTYIDGISLSQYNLPNNENFTSLPENLFCNCISLEGDLHLPKYITTLDSRALFGCFNLNSVHFGENINRIEASNFDNTPKDIKYCTQCNKYCEIANSSLAFACPFDGSDCVSKSISPKLKYIKFAEQNIESPERAPVLFRIASNNNLLTAAIGVKVYVHADDWNYVYSDPEDENYFKSVFNLYDGDSGKAVLYPFELNYKIKANAAYSCFCEASVHHENCDCADYCKEHDYLSHTWNTYVQKNMNPDLEKFIFEEPTNYTTDLLFAPPAKEGYSFIGWTKNEFDDASEDNVSELIVDVDDVLEFSTTLYAQYKPNIYNITYESGGVIQIDDLSLNTIEAHLWKAWDNEKIDLWYDGKIFTGWYENVERTKLFNFDTYITKNTTLYAGLFTPEELYNFTLNSDNTGYSLTYTTTRQIKYAYIPEKHNNLPILSIGVGAFRNNSNIKYVIFDENSKVTSIDAYAFNNSSLKYIYIPETCNTIKEEAFFKTTDLKAYVLGGLSINTRVRYDATNPIHFEENAFDETSEIIIPRLDYDSNAYNELGSQFHIVKGDDVLVALLYKDGTASNANVIKENKLFTVYPYQKITLSAPNIDYYNYASWQSQQIGDTFVAVENNKKLTGEDIASQYNNLNSNPNSQPRYVFVATYNLQFAYSLSANEISIIGLNPIAFEEGVANLHLSIPSTIKDNNIEYPVKYIAEEAFMNLESITEIIIPSSVTKVEGAAFKNASKLSKVTFESPSALQFLGNYAFENSAITSLIIPAGVTQIAECCFANTSKLKNISFENNSLLNCIYQGAFDNSSIENIDFSNVNTSGSDFNIKDYAFNNTKKLLSLDLSKITCAYLIFDNNIFDGSSIERLILPSSTHLTLSSMLNTHKLAEVVVRETENSLISEDNKVIYNSDKTEVLYIPFALNGTLTIKNTVTTLLNKALFNGLNNINSVIVEEGPTNRIVVDNALYQLEDNYYQLIYLPAKLNIERFVVPANITLNNVTKAVSGIYDYALANNHNLKALAFAEDFMPRLMLGGEIRAAISSLYANIEAIEIPKELVLLYYGNFKNCANLKTIIIIDSADEENRRNDFIFAQADGVVVNNVSTAMQKVILRANGEVEHIIVLSDRLNAIKGNIYFETCKNIVSTSLIMRYVLNNGEVMSPSEFAYMSQLQLPSNPNKFGYDFIGWYFDEQLNEPVTEKVLYSDETLYAKYQIHNFKYTYLVDDKEFYVEEVAYLNNSLGPANTPTKKGYLFDYWEVDGQKYERSTTTAVKDLTLKCVWKKDAKYVTNKLLIIGGSVAGGISLIVILAVIISKRKNKAI